MALDLTDASCLTSDQTGGYSNCVGLLDKISNMRDRKNTIESRFAYYGPCTGQGKMKRDNCFNPSSGYNLSVVCRYFTVQKKSSTESN